jgi:hypothetical protein
LELRRVSGAPAKYYRKLDPFDPVREAGTSNGHRAFHTGARIAAFRCAAPASCGAFADQRRIVVGDEGGGCENADRR